MFTSCYKECPVGSFDLNNDGFCEFLTEDNSTEDNPNIVFVSSKIFTFEGRRNGNISKPYFSLADAIVEGA